MLLRVSISIDITTRLRNLLAELFCCVPCASSCALCPYIITSTEPAHPFSVLVSTDITKRINNLVVPLCPFVILRARCVPVLRVQQKLRSPFIELYLFSAHSCEKFKRLLNSFAHIKIKFGFAFQICKLSCTI